MKVTVNTPLAKVVAEMSTQQAMDLLLQAVKYAADYTPQAPRSVEKEPTTIEIIDDQKESEETTINAALPEPNPHATPEDQAEEDEPEKKYKTYKGFMFCKCEECGDTAGYFQKNLVMYHKCKCGHKTPLKDMKVAHVKCPNCGNYKEIRYWTNMDAERFDMTCFKCGAPIDLELNKRRNEYDTL